MTTKFLTNTQTKFLRVLKETRTDAMKNSTMVSRDELLVACSHLNMVAPPNWIVMDQSRRVSRGMYSIPEIVEIDNPTNIQYNYEEENEPMNTTFDAKATVLAMTNGDRDTIIPAQVAGVGTITVVCPQPNTQILALAKWLGLKTIVQLGGAQAIASLAYGTQSIAKVQRIVGPGNSYVAAAKKLVAGDVGIDFVAGPSEIVLVASAGDPTWIAADMLAQCEHDVEARAILLTTSTTLATEVQAQVALQLLTLPTADVASLAVANNSAIIVCQSVEEIIELVNEIAPEHLAIPDESLPVASFVDKIVNAGSIFVGRFSTEAAGDYASGPNHVLPTSGVAALRGGLSVNDFVKVITTQSLSEDALWKLIPAVTQLARAEGLEAHARSVEVRQR